MSVMEALLVLLAIVGGAAIVPLWRGPLRRVQPDPRELAREVHDEMAKVAWPALPRVVRTAAIAAAFLVPVAGLVVLLDVGFSHIP